MRVLVANAASGMDKKNDNGVAHDKRCAVVDEDVEILNGKAFTVQDVATIRYHQRLMTGAVGDSVLEGE